MKVSSLYRQWRPRLFAEMVGQEHVVTTLKNVIKRDQVGHAYIFAGPRGTGKTSAARLLAKAVNCENAGLGSDDAEPCNNCESCNAIDQGNSMSVVELDAASHRGIDDIRELQERVPYASAFGRYRVYILDEAHMLTQEAFNALLKTLEEPPEHVIFILATTEPHKIPITIQSRCQRFDFRYLTVEEVAGRLGMVIESDESLEVSEAAVWAMAGHAGGAVRDALGLLEQCRDYADGPIGEEHVRTIVGTVSREVMFDYARSLAGGDVGSLMQLVDEVSRGGADMGQFIRDLLSFFRDILLYRASGGRQEPVMPDDAVATMRRIAERFSLSFLLGCVDQLAEAADRTRYSQQPRFLLEMVSIRLAGKMGDSESSLEKEEERAPTVSGRQKKQSGARAASSSADTSNDETVPQTPGEIADDSDAASLDTPDDGEDSRGVQNAWEAITKAVRQRSLPAHALLQPARPGPARDGVFYLIFDDQFDYHRQRTQNQNKKMLEDIVKEVTGKELAVRCVMESQMDDEPQASSQAENQSRCDDDNMKEEERSGKREMRRLEGSPSLPPDREKDETGRDQKKAGGGTGEDENALERRGERPDHDSQGRAADREDDIINQVLDVFGGRVVGTPDEVGGFADEVDEPEFF